MEGEASSKALRICIPSFGSPQWGDLGSQVSLEYRQCHFQFTSTQEILWFLFSLRRLLRQHPHACASLSLPPHLCTEGWGGSGWIQKLGWFSDGAITLSAFTGMHFTHRG